MATHDYVIDNSTGANVRADINNVLQAILTNNSSSSAPSTTAAYMFWADTTTGILKIRNSSDNAWVELLQLDGTLTLEDGSASTPGLAFRDDLNTGIFSSAADTFNVATAGVERMELGATTIFNEDGADVDFRIEGDTDANLFYVDAGNDRIGIGTSSPSELFHIKSSSADCNILFESTGSGTDARIKLTGRSNGVSQIQFADEDDGNVGLLTYDHSTNSMQFRINDSERARFDSTGRLLIGHSTVTPVDNDANNPHFQVEGTGGDDSRISIRHNSTTASNPAAIYLSRSKGTSTGAKTSVASGDALGSLIFMGADGTHDTRAAIIQASCDGTPGDNDMPGRLEFFTTPDGGLNATEKMRIDSVGRVMIGNTTYNTGNMTSGATGINVAGASPQVLLHNTSADKDAYFGMSGSNLFIFSADSIPIVFGTNDSEKMRITSDGKVGIGDSTPTSGLEIHAHNQVTFGSMPETIISYGTTSAYNSGSAGSGANFGGKYDSSGGVTLFAGIHGVKANTTDGNYGGNLLLSTRTHGGDSVARVKISSNGSFVQHGEVFYATSTVTTSSGVPFAFYTGGSSVSSVGSVKCRIHGDGDIENVNGNYGSISDIKLKENIVDANSQWDDIKAIKIRNYNFKAETTYPTHTQIGLIAQELELVCPKLVTETPDVDSENKELGTVTKSVNLSVLYMKAVKCLQEAITKIEVLETKVAALEAA